MVISNVKIYGINESVKASKYPMSVDISKLNDEITPRVKSLASCKKGTGHDQFLTGIIVQFDLTFTIKAWSEAERYHFLDFVSSQSTMHKIMQFDLDKAYIKYVDPRMIKIMKEKIADYNWLQGNKENDEELIRYGYSGYDINKLLDEKYLEILYSNPCGFRLTARMTTNYRQLKTIYSQRKNHRLPEWRDFCSWVESLPYSELITDGNKTLAERFEGTKPEKQKEFDWDEK